MSRLSEYEQRLIFENYEYGDFDLLSQRLGKSKHAISEWARKRGLKRRICVNRHGNLSRLLDGSHESYYWLGMYLADGYISKTGHFMLSQSVRDKQQIDRLAEFLGTNSYFIDRSQSNGYPNGKDAYRVNISDKKNGLTIRQMFNVTNKKTYDNLSVNFQIDEIISRCIIIGFIDGDGHINKAGCCSCIFNTTSSDCLLKLSLVANIGVDHIRDWRKTDGKTYAKLYIDRVNVLKLKSFAMENLLPINHRKWVNVLG